MLLEAARPQLEGSVVIKFGMVDSTLLFAIDDLRFQAPLPADGVCVAHDQFPVLVVDGGGWPTRFDVFPGQLPFAEPLLSRKDGPQR